MKSSVLLFFAAAILAVSPFASAYGHNPHTQEVIEKIQQVIETLLSPSGLQGMGYGVLIALIIWLIIWLIMPKHIKDVAILQWKRQFGILTEKDREEERRKNAEALADAIVRKQSEQKSQIERPIQHSSESPPSPSNIEYPCPHCGEDLGGAALIVFCPHCRKIARQKLDK